MESEQKIVANRANVPTKGDNILVMPSQRYMCPERYTLLHIGAWRVIKY